MIREPSVVVLDYYETLAEISTSMRERVFASSTSMRYVKPTRPGH